MSGHNKWAKIKRKKGAADQKRGALFSRLAKEITVAAKAGGGNPDANIRLRTAIDSAKAVSMPGDSIDKAIKRGTGQLPGIVYEEVTYEGYAPGGIAVIVQCLTDSRNRTTAALRHIFTKNGGNLGETGGVGWMFQRLGIITVSRARHKEDEVIEAALNAGADDVESFDDIFQVKTDAAKVHEVADAMKKAGIAFESADVQMIPSNWITPGDADARAAMRLIGLIEEEDDVQNVYSNLEPPEALLTEEG